MTAKTGAAVASDVRNPIMSLDARSIVETGAGLARLYATDALSPVEGLRAYLARIEALNPGLNAFLFIDWAAALEAAELSALRWRKASPLSSLDGVPIGIKANIAVRGWPWHCGIEAYRDRVAPDDAACVARLRAAGAVLVGGLNMDEAALGVRTDNLAFGRCRNPHDHARTAGGSSGGSACAVAAGMCAAALGTDTMGSVRIPASYCGVFGHKPAQGEIPTAGVTPLSWTLDTVGALGRSAEDVAELLEILHPSSRRDFGRDESLRGLTLGSIDLSDQVELEGDVSDAFQATLEKARASGANVVAARLPSYDVVAARRAALLVAEVEGFVEHEAMLRERPSGFTPGLTALLEWGSRQRAPGLASAYRRLGTMRRGMHADMAVFDALLMPTTPQTAFGFAEPTPTNASAFTLIANIAGVPATAFPAGSPSHGPPASVQVVTRCEATSLYLAGRLARPPTFAFEPTASGRGVDA